MYRIYQVEYGDTLEKIAYKVGTSVDNIKRINSFNNNNDLVVGSLIIVPKEGEENFEIYKVKKGDSIFAIANKYGIDSQTLLLLNGLNKDDYIYPDQDITVPKNNVAIYVTREGDTIDAIANNFGIDLNTLNNENERIFVMEDQLIVHKRA